MEDFLKTTYRISAEDYFSGLPCPYHKAVTENGKRVIICASKPFEDG